MLREYPCVFGKNSQPCRRLHHSRTLKTWRSPRSAGIMRKNIPAVFIVPRMPLRWGGEFLDSVCSYSLPLTRLSISLGCAIQLPKSVQEGRGSE